MDAKSLQEYYRQMYSLQTIADTCPSMKSILALAERIVEVPTANVLIVGETGTGKDTLAKCLHYSSKRWNLPFVEINCAAIPENLVESELFGYEVGAFTDAKMRKRGLLEIAGEGTVFLNEIGELSPRLQPKLLSAVEDRRFFRLGGTEPVRFKARIIAATNRNLDEALRNQTLRRDLYYRLNTIQITLRPLRERPEDILPLAERFIVEMCHQHERFPVRKLSPDAAQILCSHTWPGNVRELKQVIERAVILSQADKIVGEDILLDQFDSAPQPSGVEVSRDATIRVDFPPDGISLEEVERVLIEKALEVTNGVVSRAARLLHISRDTLRYRMQKYGLTDSRQISES